jgi:hypothetical protein
VWFAPAGENTRREKTREKFNRERCRGEEIDGQHKSRWSGEGAERDVEDEDKNERYIWGVMMTMENYEVKNNNNKERKKDDQDMMSSSLVFVLSPFSAPPRPCILVVMRRAKKHRRESRNMGSEPTIGTPIAFTLALVRILVNWSIGTTGRRTLVEKM